VVIDGEVFRGAQGEHPELGHMAIDPLGPPCYCGISGCLEAIASGTAIAAAGSAAGYADSREVLAAASRGEPTAQAILSRAQHAVATAAWNLMHTFMPELIVLGGGIVDEHYAQFAPAIEASLRRATMVPRGSIGLAKAQLGTDAGPVGAASLAFRGVRPTADG
jgi:glucokinase